MRAPEIERKIVAEVNRRGAIPRGRARALSGLPTAAADEMLESLVEGDVILDIGEDWLAAPVPPVPAPGARPAERTRPTDPHERMIERLALQALWDGRASVWRIARDHDERPGVTPFAVRCSLRFAIEDGLVEWLGGDDYQLTPRGLRVIAQGELQH